jgi:hypothetical protein
MPSLQLAALDSPRDERRTCRPKSDSSPLEQKILQMIERYPT